MNVTELYRPWSASPWLVKAYTEQQLKEISLNISSVEDDEEIILPFWILDGASRDYRYIQAVISLTYFQTWLTASSLYFGTTWRTAWCLLRACRIGISDDMLRVFLSWVHLLWISWVTLCMEEEGCSLHQ